MLRRALVTVGLTLALLVVPATVAQAIPPGESLIVFAYFDSPAKQTLVGQAWSGCGQPSGSWGVTSPYRTLYFTPC
jgi:hypothetical protein